MTILTKFVPKQLLQIRRTIYYMEDDRHGMPRGGNSSLGQLLGLQNKVK